MLYICMCGHRNSHCESILKKVEAKNVKLRMTELTNILLKPLKSDSGPFFTDHNQVGTTKNDLTLQKN